MKAQQERFYPLRIAYLGHKNCLERSGGIEVVVHELATRMAALGHKVTCYNRSGHHVSGKEFDIKKFKTYKNIKMKYLPTISHRGFAAMTSSICGTICAAFGKYDVIHFHAEGSALLCWLPKLFGKKVVVTVHGLDWQREKWGHLASAYIMLGEKNAARHADEIIVLSRNIQKYFQDIYGRSTSFIPNGVLSPVPKKADLIQREFGLMENGYILFLGRLVPEKGIKYLIHAFKQVKTAKKLVIAGGSSDTSDFMNSLKELAQNDSRILFTGFVQGQLLEELYSCAYVFVLPSDLEGMPLSLLEAMSYGNCCIVSDIPECVEVVENHAVVFPHGNVDELASCLQKLCDNKATVNRYKAEAADFVCQKHNWDEIVKKTIDVYNSVQSSNLFLPKRERGM